MIGTDQQSMFPVKSDASPVLGALKSGWKGIGDWLGGPIGGDAGEGQDGLLAYRPVSRGQMISQMLLGASKGMMAQRGRYANPLGGAIQGAGEGMEAAQAQDLKLRQLAQEQQYKSAAASLANMRARTAEKQAEHAGEFTLGRTRFDASGKPIVTAPPEEMSEADKARIANEDRRIELEGRRADQTEAYQRAQLAQGAAGQAEAAGYHKTEAELARQRLEVERQNAGAPKTEPERLHNKARGYSDILAKGGKLDPEQERDYRDAWSQLAEPKITTDAMGLVQTVNPDLRHLTPPPGQATPEPGLQVAPSMPPREQMTKALETHAATQSVVETTDRIQELLAKATPGELMAGDTKARLGALALQMQGQLGDMQHTGALAEGDIKRFNDVLGALTGPGAAIGASLGYQPVKASLDELKNIALGKQRAAALPVLNDKEGERMPKGVPYRKPDGSIWVN